MPDSTSRQYTRRPVPPKLCNTDRLFAAMAARSVDGVVSHTGVNAYYLSGFQPHKSAPDHGGYYAVVMACNEPDHPVLLAPDLDLARFEHQSTWIEDVRCYATLLLPLDVPVTGAELHRFVPKVLFDSPWGKRVAAAYHESIVDAAVAALRDLGLETGRVAFDNLDFAEHVRSALPGITVVPGAGLLRYVRAEKTAAEIDILRTATQINQGALEHTIAAWVPGMTWHDICHAYHTNALALGGFVDAPGGMAIANPDTADPAWHANAFVDDYVLREGTNIMFDCHGRYSGYCWDGGKTWVVGGEPTPTTDRAWQATTTAMEEIQARLEPGQKISDAVATGRAVYQKFGFDTDSILIFFHGLGLDHLDQELTGGRTDWEFIDNMVISTHIVFQGGDRDRVFMEDIAVVRAEGADRFFSWGPDLMLG